MHTSNAPAPPTDAEAPAAASRPAMPPGARESPEPPSETQERRRFQRAEFATQISFESEHNFYTGFTEDVSEGGLFVATHQLQPIGTEIDITFSLPDGHIVHARGQVRWIRDPRDETPGAPPGMGVEFEELLSEDHRAVQAFIEARTPLFYED